MLSNRKALKAVKGQMETAEALEEFKAAQADLESALISADTGILQPTKPKDVAIQELAAAIAELSTATKAVAAAAKSSPEDLGEAMKKCSAATTKAVAATTALAANIDDKVLQKGREMKMSWSRKNSKFSVFFCCCSDFFFLCSYLE